MPNFIGIEHTYRVWCIKYVKSAENIYGSYIQIWTDFNIIWLIYFLIKIPLHIPNFFGIEHTYRVWCIKYMKSVENIYESYIQIWTDFNIIWQMYICFNFRYTFQISLKLEIHSVFGASNTWNRSKIYMGAISKSEPISI